MKWVGHAMLHNNASTITIVLLELITNPGPPILAISRQSGDFEGPVATDFWWRFATQKVAILEALGAPPKSGDFGPKTGDFGPKIGDFRPFFGWKNFY